MKVKLFDVLAIRAMVKFFVKTENKFVWMNGFIFLNGLNGFGFAVFLKYVLSYLFYF